MFPESNPKHLITFVKSGKGKKNQLSEELQQKRDGMLSEVIALDPFSGVDTERITQLIQEEDEIE